MLVLLIGLTVLILDQWTKHAVRSSFVFGESRPVIDGFFNLVYVLNDGAAWNLFSGQGVFLIFVSFTVLVLLVVYRRAFLNEGLFSRVLLGLMLGGIAGNLIDRIRFGWVTDFLDFEFGSYHYPSFNVADSAICMAVVLYIISGFVASRKAAPAAGDEDAPHD